MIPIHPNIMVAPLALAQTRDCVVAPETTK